jgi:hypothetical protein
MALLQSLASVLRALMIGEKVKSTLRPETGRLFPIDGRTLEKSGDAGQFSLESASGAIQIHAGDVLSITSSEADTPLPSSAWGI